MKLPKRDGPNADETKVRAQQVRAGASGFLNIDVQLPPVTTSIQWRRSVTGARLTATPLPLPKRTPCALRKI
jgi:hypothetical protein